MSRRYYSSIAARTTLSAGIDGVTSTVPVTAVAGWPASFPYTLLIDKDTVNEEIVSVTGRAGVTLTVTRGVDGSTAAAHSSGAVVQHGVSARDFDETNSFINTAGSVTTTLLADSSVTTAKIADGTIVDADVNATAAIAQSKVATLVADLALKTDIISELVTLNAFAANVLTVDLSTGNVKQVTAAPTGAWTANVTNAPTTDGKAITVALFVTQGATGYIPTTFQIAGVGQTILWSGGTAPTATSTAGKVDIFSFTLLRMAGAWIVYGSMLAKF